MYIHRFYGPLAKVFAKECMYNIYTLFPQCKVQTPMTSIRSISLSAEIKLQYINGAKEVNIAVQYVLLIVMHNMYIGSRNNLLSVLLSAGQGGLLDRASLER